jgi:uncharacterized protein YjbJ (UPF0337 family)
MPSITQIAGVVEPQRIYNWEVLITRAPAGVGFADGLKFRAKEVDIPGREFDDININYKWMNWKVSGRESENKEGSMTFWEGIDHAVRDALMNWAKVVGDWATGQQGTKQEVSGEIQVSLMDGKDQTVKTVVFKNVMVNKFDSQTVNYDASNTLEYKCSFTYDWFEER